MLPAQVSEPVALGMEWLARHCTASPHYAAHRRAAHRHAWPRPALLRAEITFYYYSRHCASP